MEVSNEQRPILMHLINSYSLAGAEKLVFDLITRIDKHKFEVLVCSMGHLKDSIEEGVYNQLRRSGIQAHVLGKPPLKKRLSTILKLRKLLQDNCVTILHTHCPSPDFYGKLGALLAGTPLVFSTIHNVQGYHAMHENILGRLTTGYVAISETVRQYATSDLRIPSGDIEVIYNGIDDRRFRPASTDKTAMLRALGIPEGRKIVTTVGTCQERKGHHYLIEAAGRVVKSFPDTHFLIVGDTYADPVFTNCVKQKIVNESLQGNILLTGRRTEIPELLSVSDIFVMPSLWEGLPIALLEAMASELPVVVTDVGSNAEVVKDGANGFIVPPQNPTFLAQRIEELLADRVKAKTLGIEGQKTVKKSFGIAQLVNKHEALYLNHFHRIKK